ESLSFLVKHGRQSALREISKKIAPEHEFDARVEFVSSSESIGQGASIAGLFQNGRGFSTVMIWIAFMSGLFMVYGLNSWLTKLMAMSGFSLGSALTFVLVFNTGAMVGAIAGGWL